MIENTSRNESVNSLVGMDNKVSRRDVMRTLGIGLASMPLIMHGKMMETLVFQLNYQVISHGMMRGHMLTQLVEQEQTGGTKLQG